MKVVQLPEKTKLIQVLKEVIEWLEDPERQMLTDDRSHEEGQAHA